LDRWWTVELSGSKGHSEGKNVLFKKVLADKFFHVPSESSAMSSHVSLAIVEGIVLLCFRDDRIVMVWLWVPDPRLVFDGIINLVDGKSQWSEVFPF